MSLDVRCAVCHREERWSTSVPAEVVTEGGLRRSADDAQWVRGRTALRASAGELPPVVGVCEACGQLMVGHGPAPVAVRIDTPEGALNIDGGRMEGPNGPLTREEAEAFLGRQYRRPRFEGLAGDLGRATLFLGLLGPVVYWLVGVAILWTFFSGLMTEPPAAVTMQPE